jgi:hypothetical protein
MYDYISLFSDDKYSGKILTDALECFLLDELKFTKERTLVFSKRINGENIRLSGILADANGNYAHDTIDGLNEINLIEIDIPDAIDSQIEERILEIAIEIGKKFSWCIFDHETSSMIAW